MSQSGPAPRPPSRQSSGSPVGHEATSPRQHVRLPGAEAVRGGSTGAAAVESVGSSQYLPAKALGVHSILNPPEPRPSGPDSNRPFSSRPKEGNGSFGAEQSSRTVPGSSSFVQPRTGFALHAGASVGNLSPLGRESSSGRNSPIAAYQFPAVNEAGNVSSPRLLRTSGLPHERQPRPQSLVTATSPVKRPYETEASFVRQHPGPRFGSGRAVASSLMTSPRAAAQSFSQGSDVSYAPTHTRHQSLHALPQVHHGAPPGRPLSAIGGSGDGSLPWSDTMRRSDVGVALSGADEQQAFMRFPGSDSPIRVSVDYTQASKKADEKRERNARASTRHRRKKKTQQEDNRRALQDLKDERQQLMEEMEDLKQQRDFYRDERNRLRAIVARTPGIHHHASGPASPSDKGLESHGELSPPNAQIPTPSQSYVSHPLPTERPARRRRTDDRHDFLAHAYGASGSLQPPALASMPGAPAFGDPARPASATSSGSGERLPRLRAMEGSLSAQAIMTGHPQEQDPRTGQFPPRQHETGWATAPRTMYNGHGSHWQ